MNFEIAIFESVDRYEDTGDAAAGHSSHAGQRSSAMFLRLLHIRYCRCSTVGGYPAPALLPEGSTKREIPRVSLQTLAACFHIHTYTLLYVYSSVLYTFPVARAQPPFSPFIITLYLHPLRPFSSLLLFLRTLPAPGSTRTVVNNNYTGRKYASLEFFRLSIPFLLILGSPSFS